LQELLDQNPSGRENPFTQKGEEKMNISTVCVVGGSGFVGQHLVMELGRRRYRLRVLTRRRERHRELLVLPTVEVLETNVHRVSELEARLQGCEAVVNLAGILHESPGAGRDFLSVHVTLARSIAEICRAQGVRRLLHMSALGAAPAAPSRYLQTKGEGEAAVHALGGENLHVTSFRPSVIFGPEDAFFNRFAALLAGIPWVFPLACPESRFSPVYVGDVVRAFADSLENKATFGQRYDLCGPREYTLKSLVEYTARVRGISRRIVGLSDRLSRLQANIFEKIPGKPFTRDNYLSLQVPSTCRDNGLEALGITATSIEAIVPGYLGQRDRQYLYRQWRDTAGR
jgi:NADH dehydrogenase